MSRVLLLVIFALPLLAVEPVRTLVVTGGHDHEPSFYSVFDDSRITANVDPHPNAFRRDFTKRYDVLVLYDMMLDLGDDKRRANLRAFVEAGKGVVVLHHAIGNNTNWTWWTEEVVGGRYRFKPEGDSPASSYKHDEMVKVSVVKKHPVTAGIDDFIIHDETYKGMWISPRVETLLRTDNPTTDGPIAWLGLHPKARVVYIQLGDDHHAHRHPSFQRLIGNAIVWAGGR